MFLGGLLLDEVGYAGFLNKIYKNHYIIVPIVKIDFSLNSQLSTVLSNKKQDIWVLLKKWLMMTKEIDRI